MEEMNIMELLDEIGRIVKEQMDDPEVNEGLQVTKEFVAKTKDMDESMFIACVTTVIHFYCNEHGLNPIDTVLRIVMHV